MLAGEVATLTISGVGSFVPIGVAVSSGIVLPAFLLALPLVLAVTAMIGDRVWWLARCAPGLGTPEHRAGYHGRPAVGPGASSRVRHAWPVQAVKR
jgi:uncharacterized membrane protein YdfJ with MMPL/SSD domain